MAYIQSYKAQPYQFVSGKWRKDDARKSKTNYLIFWSDCKPWIEALIYLSEKRSKSSTLRSNAYDLKAYADWLEDNNITWLHFPIRQAERCLERFRGHLIRSSNGTSAVPSRRMNAVVNFYKWAQKRGYIDKQIKMWGEQEISVTYFNKTGFQRTLTVSTTDLRISHRKANISKLEDGLLPLSGEDRDTLLTYLNEHKSESNTVLHAMFVIGFFTGSRIGSIRTMKIENLKRAIPDKIDPNIMLVAAGPGTGVNTKYDVRGFIRFLKPVYDFILDYAETNITRLKRQAKAHKDNKSLLFLTKDGQRYSEGSINTAMSELRRSLIRDGYTQFHDLKFHQSRATCGTELAREFMKQSDNDAINNVRDWLMHKNEATTWKYVKFLQNSKTARKANKAFIRYFLGPNFS
ncbi:tyrosine-type recombinase/integrase [Kangiella sp. HZ709]|uniref:tyrosine-type recombinase/integrase n=1 Tax=Kangiella sp. HZ709 TaxID=2666328 RepID=UPI0012B0898D|nr:tyrosine-type recombinase/integrase [Kangiella sp. HZ709]MRX27545.1 tyrosine-type recombinase/integrase [Kangiella sp. HZ709]